MLHLPAAQLKPDVVPGGFGGIGLWTHCVIKYDALFPYAKIFAVLQQVPFHFRGLPVEKLAVFLPTFSAEIPSCCISLATARTSIGVHAAAHDSRHEAGIPSADCGQRSTKRAVKIDLPRPAIDHPTKHDKALCLSLSLCVGKLFEH